MVSRLSTSISAKLFYLMTGLLLISITAVSVQASYKFKAYLTQQIQDSARAQAERAASEAASLIESWVGKASVILSKINTEENSKQSSFEIAEFLRKNSELLAMSVFVADTTSFHEIAGIPSPLPLHSSRDESAIDVRYEKKRPDDVIKSSMQIARSNLNLIMKDNGSEEVSFFNLAPETNLPLMQLAIRLEISGTTKRAYIFLTAWQTRLVIGLPKSRFTRAFILDEKGKIFASPLFSDTKRSQTIKSSPIAKAALAKTAPSGFIDTYRSHSGEERLGAYAQITAYPSLYVLIEKDAAASFRIISNNYISTALWAAFFILIAILISYLSAKSITKAIRELGAVTRAIARGNFDVRVLPRTNDEIAELGYSVNHMASQIVALMSVQLEKARYENELETARMVQSTFFPKQDIHNKYLKVTGFYQPATECGGDLWGHYAVDEHRQFLFIADAMGHGAPAALMTAIGYATCQAVASLLSDKTDLDPSPGKLLERLNRIIFDATDGKISMTFFAVMFDFQRGVMTYANAGHNFPVVMTSNASDARLTKSAKAKAAKNYLIPLQLQGVPLGVEREALFKEKSLDMAPSDRIVLFTDGLIENHLPDQSPFSRKLLLELLAKDDGGNCTEIKERVLDRAVQTFGDKNLADDVTIVVAEVSRAWAVSPRPELDLMLSSAV